MLRGRRGRWWRDALLACLSVARRAPRPVRGARRRICRGTLGPLVREGRRHVTYASASAPAVGEAAGLLLPGTAAHDLGAARARRALADLGSGRGDGRGGLEGGGPRGAHIARAEQQEGGRCVR